MSSFVEKKKTIYAETKSSLKWPEHALSQLRGIIAKWESFNAFPTNLHLSSPYILQFFDFLSLIGRFSHNKYFHHTSYLQLISTFRTWFPLRSAFMRMNSSDRHARRCPQNETLPDLNAFFQQPAKLFVDFKRK